jgi:hypothetical protein
VALKQAHMYSIDKSSLHCEPVVQRRLDPNGAQVLAPPPPSERDGLAALSGEATRSSPVATATTRRAVRPCSQHCNARIQLQPSLCA